ncbi:hypothetical protein B1R32_11263 [Abditibacterium utsteinense]|uniref:Uncharacterized protein n=1 Tax=Abditibacterium utsteinense TaxID=1960156 RepID=A0A2S8SRK3_9BACT|nr:hypothetical protein [Abditibacterium utsteinense]PQV63408.1 hypothetical protein B1R32_11263 [Abditibacterium utsteinense]
MKKVVCPACGLINLEKFVTFPHCAACGALLSGESAPHTTVWKRPVSAPLWAMILGLCCAGLGVLGILTARETRRVEEKQLLAYVGLPRRMTVGRVSGLRISLDTTDADAVASAAPFEDVRLRFPRALFGDFVLLSISPVPDAVTSQGSGRYFHFSRLARDQPLGVLLRPLRAGTHHLSMTLNARECLPLELRGTFQVEPAAVKSAPVRPAPRKNAAKRGRENGERAG